MGERGNLGAGAAKVGSEVERERHFLSSVANLSHDRHGLKRGGRKKSQLDFLIFISNRRKRFARKKIESFSSVRALSLRFGANDICSADDDNDDVGVDGG